MESDIIRSQIQHTMTRLQKLLERDDSDLNEVRLECDTLSQFVGQMTPFEHEDVGATQDPVLIYDANVTLEFKPDGRQILRVALADQNEPLLVSKSGDWVYEGDEFDEFVAKANKWLQIDYHIDTHREA